MKRSSPCARALAASAFLAGIAGVLACSVAPSYEIPAVALRASDGAPLHLDRVVGAAPFTVITFFSSTCPCQRAHDGRLRELADHYRASGVSFVAVDAESSTTLAEDAEETKRRAIPYPLVRDPNGVVADALGASYATYTVVVDRSGRVRYTGAVDSDIKDLSPTATFYLRDALDDLLAGREVRLRHTDALGCVLRRR